jgi:hypothetical protein
MSPGPVPQLPVPRVAGERVPEVVRRTLAAALFLRIDPAAATAAFARPPLAEDLVARVAGRTGELLDALAARVPMDHQVTGGAGEPGLVLVTTTAGGPRSAVGVQVLGHAELLLRERVDALPAARDRFHAAHGPDAGWYALLAGDLADHRVRQRVMAVHSSFAGTGDLVVSPQYSSAFLGLPPSGVGALVAGVVQSGGARARPA